MPAGHVIFRILDVTRQMEKHIVVRAVARQQRKARDQSRRARAQSIKT